MDSWSEEDYFYKLEDMVVSVGQFLRQVFKERWKAVVGHEEWQNESAFITRFIEGPGKQAFRKALSFQKDALKSKSSIEYWDISLLTHVLQNFGSETKYARENVAVSELKKLRNEMAHHPTRKFSQEEYNNKVDTFRASLRTLGMKVEDVEELVDKAGLPSSLKALERVMRLYDEAEKLMKKKKSNYGKAIKCYSDALSTPGLLAVNVGEAYENRAHCYLESVKKLANPDYCKQALMDAQKALELNPNSWRAHYLAAQCYRSKRKFSQAIQCCEQALRISPAQEIVNIKAELNKNKVLDGRQSCRDHLNPQLLPVTMEERLAQMENDCGFAISEKDYIRFSTETASKLCKGQDFVNRGHQFFIGQQDYKKAAQHYAKANREGNLEGSYYYAQCFNYGHGVDQDVTEALRIYRRLAEMDVNTIGNTTPCEVNIGVAGSQHSIGLMHHYGIEVEQNYAEAAIWYKKAMDNGMAEAANNLGILHIKGLGVPLDEKMAEMCWKQGLELKAVNPAGSLMAYYLDELEPEKALHMLRFARKMGHASLISITDEEFQRTYKLDNMRAERSVLEPDVLKFEKDNSLGTKGLTFKQRLERKLNNGESLPAAIRNLLISHDPDGCGDKVGYVSMKITENMISQMKPLGILDRKEYLKSPTRKMFLRKHRKSLNKKCPENNSVDCWRNSQAPKLKQCFPRIKTNMKRITLDLMYSTEDQIFENRILELTIIDDPNPYLGAIQLIAEDENGDTTQLRICKVKTDEKTLEKIQPGCRIALINPYKQVGTMDYCDVIRVDEPKCIVYLPGVQNMCRFCGDENASLKCSKCNRPYCSKECQLLDLENFGHKLICASKL